MGMIIISPSAADCRGEGNLYSEIREMGDTGAVKVYVADITESIDPTATHRPDVESLKALIQDAHATRVSLSFDLVLNKEEADIVVHCEITEFLWTDDDPIDMISGVGPLVMDVMMNENYARMTADFSVLGNKHGRKLWERTLVATVTEKEMSRPDSVYMINERMVEVFMRDCYSKHHDLIR